MFDDFSHRLRFRLTTMLDERRPLDAMLGLPSAFAIMMLAFMILNSRSDVSTEQLDSLERNAQSQLDSGRFVEARIIAKRIAQSGAQTMQAAVIEAKALRGMGKHREAARLLARVAPLNHPGFAPAHVMQAAVLLSQEQPDPAAARQHITNALLGDPENQDALELAARFAAGQKEWKTVLTYLGRINIDQRADLLLMKATALQLSGMADESVKYAQRAEDALRNLKSPANDGSDRIRYSIAASLTLQREFEKAVQWMLDATGSNYTKEDRQVLGGIYFSWSRHLKEQSPVNKAKVLELLEKAIQISPESQDIIMAFLEDCAALMTSPAEKQHYVERVLGQGGIATSFMHYYMGVQDWQQGERESARSHFELASSLNPGFKVITNNLAMAIAATCTDTTELEKALAMMNELLRQEPNNSFFLDTRGHVQAKMGRFKEAVSDLEHALPNARDQDATHARLADLYQQLGMADLAAQHRAAALVHVAPSVRTTSAAR